MSYALRKLLANAVNLIILLDPFDVLVEILRKRFPLQVEEILRVLEGNVKVCVAFN